MNNIDNLNKKKNELLNRRKKLFEELGNINIELDNLQFASLSKYYKRRFDDEEEYTYIKVFGNRHILEVNSDGITQNILTDNLNDYDICSKEEFDENFDKVVKALKSF